MTRAKRPDLVRLFEGEVRRAKVAGELDKDAAVDVAVARRICEAIADPATPGSQLPGLANALELLREKMGLGPAPDRGDDLERFLEALSSDAPSGS